MVRTLSTMQELGTQAPDFRLPDYNGRLFSLKDFREKPALLVMFICNHCPFVKHIRSVLAEFVKEYQAKGLAVVAISSNDTVAYPEDSPDKMKEEAEKAGYSFPYLYDESQAVAKAYRAACTPDLFLFDGKRSLVYRGQFDGSRPGNDVPVTGEDVRRAADLILAGRSVFPEQRPSIGCNIKWKPGNEPDYFSS